MKPGYPLFCNCTGTPPWPEMVRLNPDLDLNLDVNVDGANRYDAYRYDVCRECGVIREQTPAQVRWHAADQQAALPAQVVQQARQALAQVAPELVLIPAGPFLMGSSAAELEAILSDCHDSQQRWYAGEQPQHTVHVAAFAIAKTPVTNAQYRAFIKATGYPPPKHWQDTRPPFARDNHPAVGISWHDALAYCQWLTEQSGQPHALPTEAQWEKAARGANGSTYPWGDEFDITQCNSIEAGQCATTPVETYAQGASPYGVLDMAGNVWEWTQSVYASYPYNPKDGREDPLTQGRRVLRGGAYYYSRYDVRCACRSSYAPNDSHELIGFRPVISPCPAAGK